MGWGRCSGTHHLTGSIQGQMTALGVEEENANLDKDQTLTPESSLPEIIAAPSCVNRNTFTRR